MNAEQIKDEIRKLSRIDKIEIYRWIDEEAAADLLSRIGVSRSREIRQEIEAKCKVITRKSVYLPNSRNETDHQLLATRTTDERPAGGCQN
jgi:hypothetical protein